MDKSIVTRFIGIRTVGGETPESTPSELSRHDNREIWTHIGRQPWVATMVALFKIVSSEVVEGGIMVCMRVCM